MKGILLSGPTGVGKSTIQRQLHEHYNFWIPRTCTTRQVETEENDLLHLSEIDFLEETRRGKIVLPYSFGGNWYGWLKEDLEAIGNNSGRAVLNLRPYPALILQALLPGFVAVWLTLNEAELLRRRRQRLAQRDLDEPLRMRREQQDLEDIVYKSCFANVCVADADAVRNLLQIVP